MQFYPALREVKLEDFKVRVLRVVKARPRSSACLSNRRMETAGGGRSGVSTNMIEAAWLALIDSLKYKLMKDASRKTRKENNRADRLAGTMSRNQVWQKTSIGKISVSSTRKPIVSSRLNTKTARGGRS